MQDLEEQSRLIAASSRPPNPPAPDGQFLVLSSSQSEESDPGEEGKKRGESEAWRPPEDFLAPPGEPRLVLAQELLENATRPPGLPGTEKQTFPLCWKSAMEDKPNAPFTTGGGEKKKNLNEF